MDITKNNWWAEESLEGMESCESGVFYFLEIPLDIYGMMTLEKISEALKQGKIVFQVID